MVSATEAQTPQDVDGFRLTPPVGALVEVAIEDGDRLDGVIVSLTEHGAFVDTGDTTHGVAGVVWRRVWARCQGPNSSAA